MVINTRPVERAASLTHHLQAAGMTVVDIPMLTLQSRPTTAGDLTMMHQWLMSEYKALVIVSPTAAASGLAVWQSLERECKIQGNIHKQTNLDVSDVLKVPSPIIAVGDATAAVLSYLALETESYQVCQPRTANNEGMLAMPEIKSVQAGDKVLIWRGLGGRRLLVDVLQARGVHVDSIAWYERTMPLEATAQYRQWRQDFLVQHTEQIVPSSEQSKPIVQLKPVVVISSGTAFEHWTTVVNETAANATTASEALRLSDFAYVVLGERLTHKVAKQQLSHWQVDDLAPDTILNAIKSIT